MKPAVAELSLMAAVLLCSCGQDERETVLDQVVTLHDDTVFVLPEVESLCDSLGMDGSMIDVGDASLYVETEGDGIPLVLLHGGPGGTHHIFHPGFSRAAAFATVIYYDQRGCGQSEYEPGDGYSIIQSVNDLESLRSALGFDRWVVLGASYGGLLAQVYALEHPESVAGVVLVGSAVDPDISTGPTRQRDFMSEEESLRIMEMHDVKGFTIAQQIYNSFRNGDWKRQYFYRPTDEEMARIARYNWVHDPDYRSAIIDDLDGLKLEHAPVDLGVPTLIIESRWDLTWSEEKADLMRELFSNARVVVLENAGHQIWNDDPDNFFPELESFVSALDSM